MAAETGASKSDAKILMQTLHSLRRLGGEAPVSQLGSDAQKLQELLARYPRIFDVFLPGHLLSRAEHVEVWVRIRGDAPTAKFELRRKRSPYAAEVLEAIPVTAAADNDCEGRQTQPVKRQRKLGQRTLDAEVKRQKKLEQRTLDAEVISSDTESDLFEEIASSEGSCDSDSGSGSDSSPRAHAPPLDEVFQNCRRFWQITANADPSKGRRGLFLLPAGELGALRPGHDALLFSFDFSTKVLYEYVQESGTCAVVWTPVEPATNAAIWTVLPLPPEDQTAAEQAAKFMYSA